MHHTDPLYAKLHAIACWKLLYIAWQGLGEYHTTCDFTVIMSSLHGSVICASDGAQFKITESTINTVIVIFGIPCILKDGAGY